MSIFIINGMPYYSSNKFYCNFMHYSGSWDQDHLFGMDQTLVADLQFNSTSDSSQECPIIFQQFISEIPLNCEVFAFISDPDSDSQEWSCEESYQLTRKVAREVIAPKESIEMQRAQQKNSNAIKKFGRAIMENLQEYRIEGRKNQGATNMLQLLNCHEKRKNNTKAIDSFNISHLKALFDTNDPHLSQHNRMVTRTLFSRKMRSLVLESCQIKNNRKLIYLKTFKCCSLRLPIRNIAHRLSASQK